MERDEIYCSPGLFYSCIPFSDKPMFIAPCKNSHKESSKSEISEKGTDGMNEKMKDWKLDKARQDKPTNNIPDTSGMIQRQLK